MLASIELENRQLRQRVALLEREVERLTRESSQYLANWVAAQDLAAWRTVEVLCKEGPLTGTSIR